jgi:N-acetylglucosaminyldiphosphoundecaprenol N-acetyl-beta-D-mannosaminyltransferase
MRKFPVKKVLSIPIAAVRLPQVLDLVHQAITEREHLQIGVVNAAKVANMRRDALLRDDVLSSDIILADGIAVVWASKVLGAALPERVTGIDLMFGMFERGNQHGYRVYCLGATDEVLARVVTRIAAEYPGVQVVGARNGYFNHAEESSVAAAIAAAKPDILLVAMTSPKKEKFLGRWSSELKVPVCHGVGGSFDVMAGKVDRAPALWQRLGLEWLYRVKQEPGRLWRRYLVTNMLFVLLVLRELIVGGAAPANVAGSME